MMFGNDFSSYKKVQVIRNFCWITGPLCRMFSPPSFVSSIVMSSFPGTLLFFILYSARFISCLYLVYLRIHHLRAYLLLRAEFGSIYFSINFFCHLLSIGIVVVLLFVLSIPSFYFRLLLFPNTFVYLLLLVSLLLLAFMFSCICCSLNSFFLCSILVCLLSFMVLVLSFFCNFLSNFFYCCCYIIY